MSRAINYTRMKRVGTKLNSINLIDPTQSDIQFKAISFPDGQPHIKMDVESAKKLNKHPCKL